MPARKKSGKPKKPAKKAATRKRTTTPKKASKAKKAAKPAAPHFVPEEEDTQVISGPVCIKKGNKWFFMKPDGDGHLIVCDGPFATKEDCEQNAVCE